MRTAVRTRMGVPAADAFYTDAVLTDLLNEALFSVSSENDWPWLRATETINTVSGTSIYTPAANWNRTKNLVISGYEPLVWVSENELDVITGSGAPERFTMNGDTIEMKPIPDGVYAVTHRYWRNETILSADGDTPAMPASFHYSIVAFAAYLAHNRAHEIDRANQELNVYKLWLERMQSYRRRSAGPIRPRVRPGSGF